MNLSIAASALGHLCPGLCLQQGILYYVSLADDVFLARCQSKVTVRRSCNLTMLPFHMTVILMVRLGSITTRKSSIGWGISEHPTPAEVPVSWEDYPALALKRRWQYNPAGTETHQTDPLTQRRAC